VRLPQPEHSRKKNALMPVAFPASPLIPKNAGNELQNARGSRMIIDFLSGFFLSGKSARPSRGATQLPAANLSAKANVVIPFDARREN